MIETQQEKQAFLSFYGTKKEVLDVYMSQSGWVWFVTKMPRTTPVWEGLVRGIETEFGSFYKNDLLNSADIFQVPKEEWKNFEEIIFK